MGNKDYANARGRGWGGSEDKQAESRDKRAMKERNKREENINSLISYYFRTILFHTQRQKEMGNMLGCCRKPKEEGIIRNPKIKSIWHNLTTISEEVSAGAEAKLS